jgi:flagellar basal-body rod protein FlgF
MPRGIYAAASAMVVESATQDVVARNLANVQTTGYRHETALRTSFEQVLAKQDPGNPNASSALGILPAGSYYGFATGSLAQTGAPLDAAITGQAFFTVHDQHGAPLLTKAGHFALDAQGRMVTPEGYEVQGQGGPIVIPPGAGAITIDTSGRVIVAGSNGAPATVLDQLRLASVDRPSAMTAVTGQYFAPGSQALTDPAAFQVHQGYLEHANIEPTQELVQMVAVQRRYEAAENAMKTQANVGGNLTSLLAGNA